MRRFSVFFLLFALLLAGCSVRMAQPTPADLEMGTSLTAPTSSVPTAVPSRAVPTPTEQAVAPPPLAPTLLPARESGILYTFDVNFRDFEWVTNTRVYVLSAVTGYMDEYLGGWMLDFQSGEATVWAEPPLAEDFLLTIRAQGRGDPIRPEVSLDGNLVVYELPGQERPGGDLIEPRDLWYLRRGGTPVLIRERFMTECASRERPVRWLGDGHVMMFFCRPLYGNPLYMLVDLNQLALRDVIMPLPFGWGNVSPEYLDMAHRSQSLVYTGWDMKAQGDGYIEQDALLLVATNDLSRTLAAGPQPEVLFASTEEKPVAPRWSADDEWVYFWVRGRKVEGQEQAISLRRLNLASRQVEEVLGAATVKAALGERYADFAAGSFGLLWWALSPQRDQALVVIVGREDFLWLVPLKP